MPSILLFKKRNMLEPHCQKYRLGRVLEHWILGLQVAYVLGGALNLMSEVGEEISQQMPQQTIHAGDVIDVQMTARLLE